MKADALDDAILRRYLLGTLGTESRLAVEARMFSDDRIFWERLSLVEDDLIDDFVKSALDAEERARFEQHFLCTEERRGKLEFACAVRRYVDSRTETQSLPRRWFSARVAAPVWGLAAAAVLLLALPAAVNWRNAASSSPGASVSVRLLPGLVRDSQGEVSRLRIPSGTQLVRVQLDAAPERYETYRAALIDANGNELWSQSKLNAMPQNGGIVTLTLPSELLPVGDYYVRLYGFSPGGRPTPVGRYDLRVIRP
jgi:anti-sigma factor RsiW